MTVELNRILDRLETHCDRDPDDETLLYLAELCEDVERFVCALKGRAVRNRGEALSTRLDALLDGIEGAVDADTAADITVGLWSAREALKGLR